MCEAASVLSCGATCPVEAVYTRWDGVTCTGSLYSADSEFVGGNGDVVVELYNGTFLATMCCCHAWIGMYTRSYVVCGPMLRFTSIIGWWGVPTCVLAVACVQGSAQLTCLWVWAPRVSSRPAWFPGSLVSVPDVCCASFGRSLSAVAPRVTRYIRWRDAGDVDAG